LDAILTTREAHATRHSNSSGRLQKLLRVLALVPTVTTLGKNPAPATTDGMTKTPGTHILNNGPTMTTGTMITGLQHPNLSQDVDTVSTETTLMNHRSTPISLINKQEDLTAMSTILDLPATTTTTSGLKPILNGTITVKSPVT